jgi:hypothetical protein
MDKQALTAWIEAQYTTLALTPAERAAARQDMVKICKHTHGATHRDLIERFDEVVFAPIREARAEAAEQARKAAQEQARQAAAQESPEAWGERVAHLWMAEIAKRNRRATR